MSRRKAGRLWARWSRRENDWLFSWPRHKADGGWLNCVFQGIVSFPDFLRELEARGYDPKTLRVAVDSPTMPTKAPTSPVEPPK